MVPKVTCVREFLAVQYELRAVMTSNVFIADKPSARNRKRPAIVATIVFLSLIAIAEYQIRSSPQWPPPARYELGGWQVDDPPLWTLAASLNLPATVPIVWMSGASDWFAYAMDDHHLIIYVPYTFLVFSLGYFVAWHFDLSARKRIWRSGIQVGLFLLVQVFITGELIYCATEIISRPPEIHAQKTPTVLVACFWAWVLVTTMGWINVVRLKQKGRTGMSDPHRYC